MRKILTDNVIAQGVAVSKLLSSETRFKILHLLVEEYGHDICVKEIADAVGLTQSATSHQLAKLQAQGVVKPSRMGQTTCYSLDKNSKFTKLLLDTINKIVNR